MKPHVTYDRDQRELAVQRGEALFTAEVNGKPCRKSSISYQGPVEYKLAQKLTLFCLYVVEGMDPQKAFNKLFKSVVKPENQ